MKITKIGVSVLTLLYLVASSGCATRALWTKTAQLDAWNEPADNPDLHLFEARGHKDLLVVYKEYSERSDSVRTRAYWLRRNEGRIGQRREPSFVSTRSMRGLTPVSVFAGTNGPEDDAQVTYAVASVDHRSFTVFSERQPAVTHRLPVYNDGSARAIRIAFTPLAVAADITIVGGAIGYLCLVGIAQSGYPSGY